MPIQFTCPHCGVKMNVDPSYAGQTGPCSKCGEKITIPEAKPGDLPPIGAYGDPAPARSSSGCVVAVLVLAALAMTFVVCLGGFFFVATVPMKAAAQTAQSGNNLRQIGIALHTYHDIHQSFPPAYVTDEQGNKLYSWRVLILPYLDQMAIYNQFDKSKAWDSPENLALSNMMLPVFVSPGEVSGCSYFGVAGKGTVFEEGRAIKLSDVTDGTANTIGVVEVKGLNHSWAEPFDIDIDTQFSLLAGQGVGQVPQPGVNPGIQMLRLDGSLMTIINPPESMIRSMASIRGGEPLTIASGPAMSMETRAAPSVVPAQPASKSALPTPPPPASPQVVPVESPAATASPEQTESKPE